MMVLALVVVSAASAATTVVCTDPTKTVNKGTLVTPDQALDGNRSSRATRLPASRRAGPIGGLGAIVDTMDAGAVKRLHHELLHGLEELGEASSSSATRIRGVILA